MAKAVASGSHVNKAHIPETCAQCHGDIEEVYAESVHGVALQAGIEDAPACTDCHGEHNILGHLDPESPVAAKNVSSLVCSPCHSSVKLSEKYGIASDRFSTYSDSYHGLAVSAESVEAANCASCHGAHNIRNSSDSASTIHKSNLAETCGKCHPGANERFSIGSVHIDVASTEEPILYWVATAYIILIMVTIGGMVGHNILDFVRKSKRKLMVRRGLIVEERLAHRLYVRMTLNERLQHGALLISFMLLVITGFALRFPDAWWVAPIREISPFMFDLRGIVHRIAAVVMVGVSLFHIYYVIAVPRGRKLIIDLLPRFSDLTDAIGVFKYNTGISHSKPKFGRFSYIEKSEYWALVWGTIVMGVTGVIMWFDNTFMGLLTKLGWDIARTIHYYEAWLATLAIIVWHFYFIMFNPDIYPINLAFWKGTLTEEEMAEEHPLELEKIHEAEADEARRASYRQTTADVKE
jgi:cytochrome b subunit of formate dehydrogenase